MTDSTSSQPHFWTTLFTRLTRPCGGAGDGANGTSQGNDGTIGGPTPGGGRVPPHQYPGSVHFETQHRAAYQEELTTTIAAPLHPGAAVLLAAIVQLQVAGNISDPTMRQEMTTATMRTLEDDIDGICWNTYPLPPIHGFLIAAQLGAFAETLPEGQLRDLALETVRKVALRSFGITAGNQVQGAVSVANG